jgi:hypothetical protein
MSTKSPLSLLWVLVVGDIVVLAAVTLFGFASHGSLDSAGVRMLTTFLPLLAGWFAAAPFLGVYHPETAAHLVDLWRPAWAMLLAAPLATWLRALWLGTPVVPVFVAVLGGIALLALVAWRLVFVLVWSRRLAAHG